MPSLAVISIATNHCRRLSKCPALSQEFHARVESAGAPMRPVCSSAADEIVENYCSHSQQTAILRQLPRLEWLLVAFLPQRFRLVTHPRLCCHDPPHGAGW